jgi:AcrR family transcriptional regulator
MTKERLTRKEREKLQHKEDISTAALHLFSRKGFHNVSMQEIAQASEFAVGTLYNFFESKEALFEEMTRNCGKRIMAELSAIIDGTGNEVQRLRALIRYQPILLEEHAEFIKMYVTEFGQRARKLSKKRNKNDVGKVLNVKVEQLIKTGIGKGMFRSVDPAIAAMAIISTMETLAFETAGYLDKAKITDLAKKVEQLFIDGLLVQGGQENEQ